MFDKDGKLDARSQRILSEQTIPPRYGRSPGMIEGLIESRPGTEYVSIEPPTKVVAMCEFKGRLFLATERGVYEKHDDGTFRPMLFVNPTDGMLGSTEPAE